MLIEAIVHLPSYRLLVFLNSFLVCAKFCLKFFLNNVFCLMNVALFGKKMSWVGDGKVYYILIKKSARI